MRAPTMTLKLKVKDCACAAQPQPPTSSLHLCWSSNVVTPPRGHIWQCALKYTTLIIQRAEYLVVQFHFLWLNVPLLLKYMYWLLGYIINFFVFSS